jgi:hypothetical protein
MLKTKLELAEKWFATGFATKADSGEDEATRVLGIHNEDMLIVLDEAPGVADPIWAAIDRLITNPRVKVLVIGNPIYSTGKFVECFKDPKFNKITVSVFDSPNYLQDKEVVPGLAGRDFVKYVKDKFGEGTNQWKSMITGEIPDNDIDSLIQVDWIEKAEKRTEFSPPYKFIKKFVVWDVADGGNDSHIIKAFENTREIEEVEIYGKKVEEVEPYVWRLLRKVQGNCIVVDADGIGRVALSLLEQASDKSTTIIGYAGSSTEVNEPENFAYKRHEAHWRTREMFEQGKVILIPNALQKEELAAVKLVEHRKGFIAVEPKKDLKRRIGRSPDRGDCIVMMCGAFDEIPILERLDSYNLKKKDRRIYVPGDFDYSYTPETA